MSEFKCPRTQGKQKRQHMEHADAIQLRWCRGRYFYFRFTSAILFFSNHCLIASSFESGALKIYSIQPLEFHKYLVPNESFYYFRSQDFRMSVHDNTAAYQDYNYEQNTYMIPKPTSFDGCRTFLRHIFRPYISVHFRNLFVSYIALPVKSDIKKPCRQHIQVRCP